MLEMMGNERMGAQWLRVDGVGAGRTDAEQAGVFRLEFSLEAKAECATVHVSAADRYRLYVNGQSVVSGPRKGDKWNHYYETVDIATYLREGHNAITARVVAYANFDGVTTQGGPLSVYTQGMGLCFLLEGEVVLSGGAHIPLSTREACWTAALDPSYALDTRGATYVGGTEIVNLGKQIPGLMGIAPLHLPAAQKYLETGIGLWGEFSPLQLKARAIPAMQEEMGTFACELPVTPGFTFGEQGEITLPAHNHAVMELDAGALTTAYLRIALMGAGATVCITYAERYFPKDDAAHTGPMRRDDRENGKLVGQHDEITACDALRTFESFWFRTFRFVRIEAQTADSLLTLYRPEFLRTAYPLEVTARMEFPDKRMEDLYAIALRTLRSCMHDTHEDCPYYEQLQYILDTRLQMLYTYAVSGDTRMARNVLWDYHCSQLPDGILQSRYPCVRTQVIPDFSIYWIFMLEEYHQQTGDTTLLKQYRSTMDGVLDFFDRHVCEDGLVRNLGYWEFGDWVDKWDANAGTPCAVYTGASTLHNLTYALGLRTGARILRAIARDGVADEYDARADAICTAVRTQCFDHVRGVLYEGDNCKDVSQHSQVLATLCGLFTDAQAQNAMRHAMQDADMLQCTFPWQYMLLRALEKTGLYDLSQPLWQSYFEMLDRNLTTIPERPGDTRSDCHAWSALPLYEYTRMLLGVKADAPGWERMLIQPHTLGLEKLSGTLPTPKGEVSVQWHIDAGQLHIVVDAPQVPYTVKLPDGRTFACVGGHFEI